MRLEGVSKAATGISKKRKQEPGGMLFAEDMAAIDNGLQPSGPVLQAGGASYSRSPTAPLVNLSYLGHSYLVQCRRQAPHSAVIALMVP